MPTAFDWRAGFDVDASHISPQGVLAAIPWFGVGLEIEGLELSWV